MRRALLWPALLLLAVPSLTVAGSSDTAAMQSLPWWGSTDPLKGYHIRIPVTVSNDAGVALQDPVAMVQLDLAELLADSGWTHTKAGGRALTEAFELDLDSIRVVSMTNLKPGSTGTVDGRLKAYDRSFPEGDLRRYVAPSLVVPGLLDSPEPRIFNARTDPAVTVFWRVQGAVAAGSEASFYVYLDSVLNPGHDTPAPTGPEAGAVESIHWAGASKVLYGFAPAPRTGEAPPSVTALALSAGTQVFVEVEDDGFRPNPGVSSFALGANQRRTVILPSADAGTPFRLTSNLPILAFMEPYGFVPSLDGGFAGNRFLFKAGDQAAYFADAGGGAPTTISVQPLSSTGDLAGNPVTFHLNDDVNGFPFTVGTWASGKCSGEAWTLSPDMTYLATVQTGGPVLLQLGDDSPLVQVPALDGGPTGRSFMPVMSDSPLVGTACSLRVRDRDWLAASDSLAATARATDPETGTALPTRAVPAAPLYGGPFTDARAIQDHAARIDATRDSWLWVGTSGGSAVPAMAGPLGGPGALQFAGTGGAVVFGLYDETSVEVQQERAVSGTSFQRETIAAGEVLRLEDGAAGDWVESFSVLSDRPVAVYPTAGRAGMLAGLPYALEGEVKPLQYRGYLFDVGPAPNSPLTKPTIPGAAVDFHLRIANRGRTATGGALPDVVDLNVQPPGPGWTAELDREVVALGGTAFQDVKLTVTPPADVAASSLPWVTVVKATSRGNPNLEVSEKAFTVIKRDFDVGIWIRDDLTGSLIKFGRLPASAAKEADYTVVVKNEGTVEDTICLEPSPPDKGWTVLLQGPGITPDCGPRKLDGVQLDGGATHTLHLVVRPPATATDDSLITTVTATSSTKSAAFDRVTATTTVSAPSDLSVEVRPLLAIGRPGREALFELRLSNEGAGSAELVLENRTDAPALWPVPDTFLLAPNGKDRIPLERITVAPGETVRLHLAQLVPAGSVAEEFVSMRVAGHTPNGTFAFEVFPSLLVASIHDVDVEEATLVLEPGGQARNVTLALSNAGNLDELFRLLPGPLPAGWSLETAELFTLLRDGQGNLDVRVRAPPSVPAGLYNLTVLLVAQDGAVVPVNFTATVPSGANPLLSGVAPIEAQPGRPAVANVPVENQANVPVRVEVLESDGESWALAPSEPLELPPGANTTLSFAWLVPRGAADGESPHAARLVFTPQSGGVPVVERPVEAQVAVGRARLVLSEESALETPGGRLVRFTLSNLGDRSAEDVEVELRSGGSVRDRMRVDMLAPGESAQLALLDAVGTGALDLVVDPDDRIVEAGEGEASLEGGAGGKGAPGLDLALLLPALLGAVLAARRRKQR